MVGGCLTHAPFHMVGGHTHSQAVYVSESACMPPGTGASR